MISYQLSKPPFLYLFAAICFLTCGKSSEPEASKAPEPVDMVYPFLDAANSRWFFFNAASRPFGLVNLSPDTQKKGAWGSGYRYHIDTVKGFSHIHAWQLSGVEVMPVLFEDDPESVFKDHSSKFDHGKEEARPGYHKLELERYGIQVELTSTTRVGFHRYTFAPNKKAGVLFNLGGLLGPSEIVKGSLEKTGPKEIRGSLVNAPTIRRPREFKVHFHVQFNHEIDEWLVRSDSTTNKIVTTFPGVPNGEPLLMKVALSYTSNEQAIKNLNVELPHWDFDRIVKESRTQWNELLSRIKVAGGSHQDRQRFYTDLWHALQGRRIISDANGQYPDYTGEERKVRQIPLNEKGLPKFNHYNSDSFWGAQWTLNTLWHLVYPEIAEEFVNSFLLYYRDGGLIPRGPSGGNYTHVMTGASGTPFVVSAYQKGIRGYDAALAYEGLKKNHMPGGTMARAGYEHTTTKGGGLEHYIEKGYVPYPLPEGNFGYHQDGASLTLEYAYQDWTLAQFAKALGKEEDHTYFLKRSENYKNQFDTASGWIRPKNIEGKWRDPFDPYEYEHGFNESNGAQSMWFVPHDPQGLAMLMGGQEVAIERLNGAFEKAGELGFTSGTSHDQERIPAFRRIPINYGNQPSIQTASIFNHLGRPDLTQFWSRQVATRVFGGLSPDTGYNGDEDQGLMGSLAVLLKIGIFQLNGGTEENPKYELGSPIFDKISIALHPDYYPGEVFEIVVNNNGKENFYIASAQINGQALNTFYVDHESIVNGGKLVLNMTADPPK